MSSITIRARVSIFIDAPPARIFQAFIEPDWLTRFWLSSASEPLQVGESVAWHFMVAGATGKSAGLTASRVRLIEARARK